MQELNTHDSLWPVPQPQAAGQPLDLSSQTIPDTVQDGSDGPESPICCWNICTGVKTRTDSIRIRRKPAND